MVCVPSWGLLGFGKRAAGKTLIMRSQADLTHLLALVKLYRDVARAVTMEM
jgi:hypothetical protein